MLGVAIAQTMFAEARRRAAQKQMAAANRAAQAGVRRRTGVFPLRTPTVTRAMRFIAAKRGVKPAPAVLPTILPTISPPILVATDGAGGAPAGATAVVTPAVEEVAQELATPEVAPAGLKGALALAAIVGAFLVFGKAGRGRRNW